MEAIEVYKKLLGEDEEFNQEEYLTISANVNTKVFLNHNSTNTQYDTNYQYKVGRSGSWLTGNIPPSASSEQYYVDVPANTKIYFKRSQETLSNTSNQVIFHVSANFTNNQYFDVFGDVTSIINHAALTNGCFYNLFSGTACHDASDLILPSSELSQWCYYAMFRGCTKLVSPPQLPSLSVPFHGYQYMFYGCTSLTATPSLPAPSIPIQGYYYMFQNCSSLSTAPALTANLVNQYGYDHMFAGCTSLTSAPQLPATKLAKNCYEAMFSGCTSLKTASEIKATQMKEKCYINMFAGCTSLTSIPTLSALVLAPSCFQNMFGRCTSLSTINSLKFSEISQLASGCFAGMFSGCTKLTDVESNFFENIEQTQVKCCQSMFQGCTKLSSIPNFPNINTTSENCYNSMYKDCTSLITATALPATNLTPSCYQKMFYNCTALTSISAYFPSWFDDDTPKPAIVPIVSSNFCWKDSNSMYFTFVSHGKNKIKIRRHYPEIRLAGQTQQGNTWSTQKTYAPINYISLYYCKNGTINDPNATDSRLKYKWQLWRDVRTVSDYQYYTPPHYYYPVNYTEFKTNIPRPRYELEMHHGNGGMSHERHEPNVPQDLFITLRHDNSHGSITDFSNNWNWTEGETITLENGETLSLWNLTPYTALEKSGAFGFQRVYDNETDENGQLEIVGCLPSLTNWQNPAHMPYAYGEYGPERDSFHYNVFYNMFYNFKNINARYLKLYYGTRYDQNGGDGSGDPANRGKNDFAPDSWHELKRGHWWDWPYFNMFNENKRSTCFLPSQKRPIYGRGDNATEQLRQYYSNTTGYVYDQMYFKGSAYAKYTQNWTSNICTQPGKFYKMAQLTQIYNGDGNTTTTTESENEAVLKIDFDGADTQDRKVVFVVKDSNNNLIGVYTETIPANKSTVVLNYNFSADPDENYNIVCYRTVDSYSIDNSGYMTLYGFDTSSTARSISIYLYKEGIISENPYTVNIPANSSTGTITNTTFDKEITFNGDTSDIQYIIIYDVYAYPIMAVTKIPMTIDGEGAYIDSSTVVSAKFIHNDQYIMVANGSHFIPSGWFPHPEPLQEPEYINVGGVDGYNLDIKQIGFKNS